MVRLILRVALSLLLCVGTAHAQQTGLVGTKKILGRTSSGTGQVEQLTAAQTLAIIELTTPLLSEAEGAAAYQPLDADLSSWAAVTRASGFDTFVTTPTAANLATLVTGESYGLTDAELACLAGQTSAADKLPYYTGSGTCALADLSSAMRTFMTTSSMANLGSLLSDDASGWITFGTTPSSANLAALVTDDVFALSDVELGAVAGLVSAADKGIYFTGSGTAAMFDLSSAERTFLTTPSMANLGSVLSDDAAGWTTFGTTPSSANLATLVTDDQFVLSDVELGSIAGLTSAADKFPYWTGSGTAATADLSSSMRTFMTTSSCANFATLTTNETFNCADVELGAIAGLTSAADTIPYFTGSGTAALATGDGDHGDITVTGDFATWTIDADSIALTTDTTGVYVSQTGDGTGIDGSCNAEACTYTPTLDLTEINSATWGSGTFTTFTFDAGATDPLLTFGSGTLLVEGVTSFRQIDSANAGGLVKLLEDPGTGSNFIGFLAPASITADVTCTLENDSNPIPDSCVGDGTDDSGAGGVSDGDKGDITVSSSGAVWNIDIDAVISGGLPLITVAGTDAGAVGPILKLQHDSATPADGDIAADIQVFAGADDEEVGRIAYEVDDGSTTTEDGQWRFFVDVAGTSAQQAALGQGLIIGTGTTFPGAGSVRLTNIELGADSDTTLARSAAGTATLEGVGVVRGATGGTDNSILRADGTGGTLLQSSPLIIADTSGAISGAASGFSIEFFGANGTDTTLTAPSAGNLTIEGNAIYRAGGTDVAVTDGGTGASSLTDLITLTTMTTGNYVKDVADGTGIDGTASGEGTTYTPSLDLTEISSATLGAGAFTALTFDAGAVDPVLTTGSGTVAWSGITSYNTKTSGAQNQLILERTDTHGDAVNITKLQFLGRDSGAASQEYAAIYAESILDNAAAEQGQIDFDVTVAGTIARRLTVGNGVIVGVQDSYPGIGNLAIDDSGEFRMYETEANGDNYFSLIAPDSLSGDVTCTIDSSGRIPDSCVGDGTDGGGVGSTAAWITTASAAALGAL